MEDDLKISGVVSLLLANIKNINILINHSKIDKLSAGKLIDCFKDIDNVLKVFNFEQKQHYSKKAQELIQKRDNARAQRNFKLADQIRDELISQNINFHDKKVTP